MKAYCFGVYVRLSAMLFILLFLGKDASAQRLSMATVTGLVGVGG